MVIKENTKQRIKIVAITGGENVPSRRYRIKSISPFLYKLGITLDELCPIVSRYPPSMRLMRIPWITAAIVERLTLIYRTMNYDAVVLQRELISTLPTIERLLPEPRILDVDDAIYVHRGGKTAKYIAKSCSLIVCGNNHLADKFSEWNRNVIVIPTGVNTELLHPISNDFSQKEKIIGWIGTAANYTYLQNIEPALKKVLGLYPTVKVQIISNQFPEFLKHFDEQLEFIPWKPGIECELLPSFTVGIMPLDDNEWSRGKCAFKMLQYMAAGIPSIVSAIGTNKEIIDKHDVGIGVITEDQWVDALVAYLSTPDAARQTGTTARQVAESEYSLNVIADKWDKALLKLLG